MMMRGRAGLALVGFCAAMVLIPGGVGLAGDSEEGQAALDRINQTWREAKCRNRIAIEIKKGADRDGWSDSPWMCNYDSATDNTAAFCFKFKVTNRKGLLPFMDGKTLRTGMRFVARGWNAKKTNGLKGVTLDLDCVDVPAQAQFTFTRRGSFNKVGTVERLGFIERYMRFEAFEVRPAGERIESVATPIAAAPPAPRPTPVPVLVRPELRLMAASVEPARVVAGEEVQLIAIYSIEGLPAGAVTIVNEWRTIRQGQRTLTTTDASVSHGPGIHQSSQPLRVPASLAPGIYELLVTIELQGAVKEATAVFEVIGRAP